MSAASAAAIDSAAGHDVVWACTFFITSTSGAGAIVHPMRKPVIP